MFRKMAGLPVYTEDGSNNSCVVGNVDDLNNRGVYNLKIDLLVSSEYG